MCIDCVYELLAATARYGGSEVTRLRINVEMLARKSNTENDFPKIVFQNLYLIFI